MEAYGMKLISRIQIIMTVTYGGFDTGHAYVGGDCMSPYGANFSHSMMVDAVAKCIPQMRDRLRVWKERV